MLNQSSFTILDLRSPYNRSLPDDLRSINYTGVIAPNFFVEGTFSNRNLKWFASTRGGGSHNVVFGYDTFNDIRIAENHQSGSDYRILGTTSIIRGQDVYPSWTPGSTTLIQWNPIDAAILGTDFRTHSLFVNDQWRVNSRLTVNLGIRWDRNDGKDSAGNVVANDSGISPRAALTFDPTGDARWTINASRSASRSGSGSELSARGQILIFHCSAPPPLLLARNGTGNSRSDPGGLLGRG